MINAFEMLNDAVKKKFNMETVNRPFKELEHIRRKYDSGENIQWLEKELIKFYRAMSKSHGSTTTI